MATNWHILGSGAIGSLFACALQRAGGQVTLLRRSNTNNDSGQIELRIDKDQASRLYQFPASSNDDSSPISHLVVTTKAYDVRSAITEVAHRLNPSSQIVLLTNGMGILEELQSDYPNFQYYCGSTTEGAYRLAPGHICHAGSGLTKLGQRHTKAAPDWFELWQNMDLACNWEADIDRCLWQKLAINCAINPLTALHQCSNGELGQQPELSHQVLQLCDEIAKVSLALGYADIAKCLHSTVNEVISATAANRSSMLQDILAGRRTEIHYLTGYLLAAAKRLDVKVPYNQNTLRSIEEIDR